MVKRSAIIISIALVLVSCIPSEYEIQTHQITSIHRYELLVKDLNGEPVEGAEVEYIIKKEGKVYDQGKFITKSDGRLELKVSHTIAYTNENYFLKTHKFSSDLEYKVSKDGMYTISGAEHISNEAHSRVRVSVVLVKPIDYINPDFIASFTGDLLKYPILNFIDIVISENLLTDTKLKPHSIDLIKYKEKNYLQFEFIPDKIYNSTEMNKYDIGIRLYNDIVKKVLSYLDKYVSDPKLFDGYDLIITGYIRDFTNKNALNQPMRYRFIIPQEKVKQYANKDISGQQVLDSSVILMGDEKIELKLR